MAKEADPGESRLLSASQALVTLNRLSLDRRFNEEFGQALEQGDAGKIGELLDGMGIQDVQLEQSRGQTGVNFRLGLTVCVQVTITVCREF